MVASQMSDALFDSTNVSIDASDTLSGRQYQFRATGSVLKFAGFRAVYMEGSDDGSESDDSANPPIPHLAAGEELDCLEIQPEQHFTQPPPRFTEASLVKALEEQGIGRPSTYAPTIATLLDRDYVVKESGRFNPTKLGKAVTGLLVEHFPDILDIRFTARVEEELDDIAEGEREWTPVIREFYLPFDRSIEKAVKEAERVPRELLDEETDEVCEKCESPMVIKSGRFGRFLACTGYPECKNTRPVESNEERALRELVSENIDELCDKCEKPMVVKSSHSGRFIGCSAYPECKNAKPFPVGIDCEKCDGAMVERRGKGKSARSFYGCINYPECNHTVNPLPQPCPGCGKLLVTVGRGRRNARCLDDTCGFTGPVPKQETDKAEL
jgi:DNA topoisomerase-1